MLRISVSDQTLCWIEMKHLLLHWKITIKACLFFGQPNHVTHNLFLFVQFLDCHLEIKMKWNENQMLHPIHQWSITTHIGYAFIALHFHFATLSLYLWCAVCPVQSKSVCHLQKTACHRRSWWAGLGCILQPVVDLQWHLWQLKIHRCTYCIQIQKCLWLGWTNKHKSVSLSNWVRPF